MQRDPTKFSTTGSSPTRVGGIICWLTLRTIATASRKVVATIAVPGKPEFAVADGKGNVYNNIEDKSLVLKIDANAKKITATWPAGCESPSGLALDLAGNRLFPVCDGNKMSV